MSEREALIRAGWLAPEDATRLIVRVAELEAGREWQPIETAPQDGSLFFAFCFEDYPQVVGWDSEVDYGFEGIRQIWKSAVTGRFVIPTHWMPLPVPPRRAGGPGR